MCVRNNAGKTERDLMELARALWPDANLLDVRGRAEESLGGHFSARRHSADVLDDQSLKNEANALADFVGWASGEHGFDAAKCVGAGLR